MLFKVAMKSFEPTCSSSARVKIANNKTAFLFFLVACAGVDRCSIVVFSSIVVFGCFSNYYY